MATLQQRARAKVIRLKQQLLKGWQIAEACGVQESVISRLYRERPVSDDACRKVLEAEIGK